MNKQFLLLIFLTICLISIAYISNVIYFPVDILNLFPAFHAKTSLIPHNTLVSDPVFQFEPWRHFIRETIFSGVFPLWNNLNAGGVPLFANTTSAILFPLNFFYYISPSSISLNLIPILKLNLLFIFTFLYLKSIKVSNGPAFLGAVAVCFSGFSLVWLLWPQTNVYMFLPLFLYLTEKIRNSKREKVWYVLLSLNYCLAMFGGHYETLLHLMLLHLPYTYLRLRLSIRKFFVFVSFLVLGILLSSIQLFPFLEYFINSSAFAYRTHSSYLYLPLQSAVLNILPFLSGAPHLSHYRPISIVTNFQESMGGYTGTIIILAAFVGFITQFRKNSLIRTWAAIAVIFWFLAYKIWPLGLLLELPLISQTQNSRLSAISAFATIVLFVLAIEKMPIHIKKQKFFVPLTFGVITLGLLFLVLAIEILTITTKLNVFHHPYVPQLNTHILFIALTTLLFIPTLYFNKKRRLFVLSIAILVSLQTIYLLAGYIPLLKTSSYYPQAPVIEKILSLQKGTVLEVGNPSIPPNTNLIYRIPHAQNYDAIEVRKYKEEFDKTFSYVNQWGKVEEVSPENLDKFNISYVLSDYNINFASQKVQPKYTTLLGPITSSKTLKADFIPTSSELMEIRLLPANYNRKNSCILEVGIIEQETNNRIFDGKVECETLLDKMYFTLESNGTELIPYKKYTLTLSSEETNKQNSVGLWGDGGVPFVELYFNKKQQPYKMLFEGNGIKLFKTPKNDIVRIKGRYGVLKDAPNELRFSYESIEDGFGEVKKTFYPGWKAYIDGKEVAIGDGRPFMKIEFPKGKHIVSLHYDPMSFKLGILMSLAGLVILVLVAKFKKLA